MKAGVVRTLIVTLVVCSSELVGQKTAPDSLAELRSKAEKGDPQAQVDLGIAYINGNGVPQDAAEGASWFKKSAEQGYPPAEDRIGQMYALGYGVTLDYNEAMHWLRRAADQGDEVGEFSVGTMYAEGKGVPADYAQAFNWFRKSADKSFPPAEYALALAYEKGMGTRQDLSAAVKLYTRAAEHGYADAMNNLAFLLATSKDTRVRNHKEALATAQKAVSIDGENPVYLDTLARCYFETGDLNKAAETERHALRLDPTKTEYKRSLEMYSKSSSAGGPAF